MKLYHGTSESSLKRILREGLLPRSASSAEGNWEHTVESSSDRVYLTKGYAPYFAASACEEGERWAILELDKDRMVNEAFSSMDNSYASVLLGSLDSGLPAGGFDHFFPDEDYVENVLRGLEKEKLAEHNEVLANEMDEFDFPWGAGCLERTAWIRDHISLFKFMSESSVENLGNVSYGKHIPLKCITRAVLYDPKTNPTMSMMALDPTISTMNWRICSTKYIELTRWFLGYRDVSARSLTGTYGNYPGVDSAEEERRFDEFDKEVLSNREGIELIEVAQFGVGGKTSLVDRQEFLEMCLNRTLGAKSKDGVRACDHIRTLMGDTVDLMTESEFIHKIEKVIGKRLLDVYLEKSF